MSDRITFSDLSVDCKDSVMEIVKLVLDEFIKQTGYENYDNSLISSIACNVWNDIPPQIKIETEFDYQRRTISY